MPAVTRIGDSDVPHCTGMSRAGGSGNVFVNGIGVSRQGDSNTPHLLPPNIPPCPGHSASISSGSSTVKVNGKGCGRVPTPEGMTTRKNAFNEFKATKPPLKKKKNKKKK